MSQTMALKARFADYLRDELGRAPGTIGEYLKHLSYVERALDKPVQAITSDELRAHKKEMLRSYSSSTVKGMVVAVRQFFTWGTLEGLSLDPAVLLVRTPKEVNDSSPPLPIEKARALLEACVRPLDYKLVYYGLYAGTRVGDSARMTVGHWQDGWLRFRDEKTGRLREIPVHPELARVERLVAAWKPSYRESLQKRKKKLAERVGFHFVAHQLRKTFSTVLHDAGVSDLCRRDLLGHALGLDGVYTLVSRREKEEAIASLSYGRELKPSRKVNQAPKAPTRDTRAKRTPGETASKRIIRAVEALEPPSRAPLVRLELEVTEPKRRAVRSVGHYTNMPFVLELASRTYHLASGPLGIEAESKCGRRFQDVTDDCAAVVLASEEDDAYAWCTCVDHVDRPPEKEPPTRLKPVIEEIRRAL